MKVKNEDFEKSIKLISEKIDLDLIRKNERAVLICSPEDEKTRATLTANLVLYWVNKDESVLLVSTDSTNMYVSSLGFNDSDKQEIKKSKIDNLYMVDLTSDDKYEKRLKEILLNKKGFDRIVVDLSDDMDRSSYLIVMACLKSILIVQKEVEIKKNVRKLLDKIHDLSNVIGYVTIK